MEQKKRLTQEYKNIWKDKTIRLITKEINSYHKYFNKTSGSWMNGQSNPSDFTPSDKLLILKELLSIKEKISNYERLIKKANKRKNKDFIDCCLVESYIKSLNKYKDILNG